MKLTETQLRKLIKEEIKKLNEGVTFYYPLTPDKQDILKDLIKALVKTPIDIKSLKKLDYGLLKKITKESDRKKGMAFFDKLPSKEYAALHWALVNISQFPFNKEELEGLNKKLLKNALKMLVQWIKKHQK